MAATGPSRSCSRHSTDPGGGQALHARSLPERLVCLLVRQVVDGLCSGQPNVLYNRLVNRRLLATELARRARRSSWPGWMPFSRRGTCTASRIGKRAFIGGHAKTPVLLVQGPPGTGKSYSTAFAVFARLQGAMQARTNVPGLPVLQDPRRHGRAAQERAGGPGEAAGTSGGRPEALQASISTRDCWTCRCTGWPRKTRRQPALSTWSKTPRRRRTRTTTPT